MTGRTYQCPARPSCSGGQLSADAELPAKHWEPEQREVVREKEEMVHLQVLHHTIASLTTVARRLCLCFAAELAALFQSAPLLFSAAHPRGQ